MELKLCLDSGKLSMCKCKCNLTVEIEFSGFDMIKKIPQYELLELSKTVTLQEERPVC